MHLCVIWKLEGRWSHYFVTVVTDGWAVADTASCEEAGVSVPLGGLWLCDLETELPVAAP